MFTGLVQIKGCVASVERSGTHGKLAVNAPAWGGVVAVGESIAINGVCLTLTRTAGDVLHFDVLDETFAKTSLGEKTSGSAVNLERALRVGDAIGGHFVTGHVDGTGVVESVRQIDRDWVLSIACSKEFTASMVKKGSICIDGVSLTIVDLTETSFSVHLIPHTWEVTSLSDLKPGDRVNLETDMLGKYVAKALEARGLG